MFLADQAFLPSGIGQAAVLVENGDADHRLLFFREIQQADGASRADLTAQGAVVLAIADAGDHQGSP